MQKCPLCPLYPPPLITIRNETFFRVDVGWRCWQAAKGWLCLTDAQRYYTTLQFWQVTGSAGVYPGFLARFSPYLVSYAGRRRDAHDPRGICNNLGCALSQHKSGCSHKISQFAHQQEFRYTIGSGILICGAEGPPSDRREPWRSTRSVSNTACNETTRPEPSVRRPIYWRISRPPSKASR